MCRIGFLPARATSKATWLPATTVRSIRRGVHKFDGRWAISLSLSLCRVSVSVSVSSKHSQPAHASSLNTYPQWGRRSHSLSNASHSVKQQGRSEPVGMGCGCGCGCLQWASPVTTCPIKFSTTLTCILSHPSASHHIPCGHTLVCHARRPACHPSWWQWAPPRCVPHDFVPISSFYLCPSVSAPVLALGTTEFD